MYSEELSTCCLGWDTTSLTIPRTTDETYGNNVEVQVCTSVDSSQDHQGPHALKAPFLTAQAEMEILEPGDSDTVSCLTDPLTPPEPAVKHRSLKLVRAPWEPEKLIEQLTLKGSELCGTSV